MTSKKKLKRRLAYWRAKAEYWQESHRLLQRRFVAGEKPTAIDRLLVDEDLSTPAFDALSGNVPTKLTWAWTTIPKPSQETPAEQQQATIQRDAEDAELEPVDPTKVHDGWLLTPRSEEKRSMKGGTE